MRLFAAYAPSGIILLAATASMLSQSCPALQIASKFFRSRFVLSDRASATVLSQHNSKAKFEKDHMLFIFCCVHICEIFPMLYKASSVSGEMVSCVLPKHAVRVRFPADAGFFLVGREKPVPDLVLMHVFVHKDGD